MAKFEKRRQFQNILYSRSSVIILMIVVVFLGFSVYSVFQKRHEAYINAESSSRELKMLTERQNQTNDEIARLKTDAGIEEAIRNKFRAIKDGEGLVVVVNNDNTNKIDSAQKPQSISIWKKITNFFGI